MNKPAVMERAFFIVVTNLIFDQRLATLKRSAPHIRKRVDQEESILTELWLVFSRHQHTTRVKDDILISLYKYFLKGLCYNLATMETFV